MIRDRITSPCETHGAATRTVHRTHAMASITASAVTPLQAARVSRVAARGATFNGVSIRPRAVRTAATRAAVPAAASAVKKDDDELKTGADTNPGFNMALAAMVAGSVFMADAVSPEWAEAARSSGRMGGSSFRAPRSGGRMGGQSRAAPNVQAMPQRSMYGGGFGMPMFMPMWSPFGYGYGFGFGGLGFIFQIMIFFWIVNFFLSFLSAMDQNNNNNNRNNYDDDDFPPRY